MTNIIGLPPAQTQSLRPDAKPFVPSSSSSQQQQQQQQQQQTQSSLSTTNRGKKSNRQRRNINDEHHNRQRRNKIERDNHFHDDKEQGIQKRPSDASFRRQKKNPKSPNQTNMLHSEDLQDKKQDDHLKLLKDESSNSQQQHRERQKHRRSKHQHHHHHRHHHPSQQQQKRQITTNTPHDNTKVFGKSALTSQSIPKKFLPSLHSNGQNEGDCDASFPALTLGNKQDVTEVPVVKSLHGIQNSSSNYNSSIWSTFKLLSVEQPADGTATPLVYHHFSTKNGDDNDVTKMITLYRNANHATTVVGNSGMFSSKESNEELLIHGATTEESPKREKLLNSNDMDHRIQTQVSRRQPSIDKLRDRWWNLVRDHVIDQEAKVQQELSEQESNIDAINAIQAVAAKFVPTGEKPNGWFSSMSSILVDDHRNHTLVDPKILDSESYVKDLIQVIQQSDTDRVKCLLSRIPAGINLVSIQLPEMDGSDSVSIIDWAVHFNQAHILRIICTRIDVESISSESMIPMLTATERSYDECLQVLISFFGVSSLLTCRDAEGNTALHYCCRSTVQRTTFPVLLDCIITSTGYTKSLLYKIYSSRNHQQQTPLHIAAMCKRADVIDLILSHRCTSNVSMLTKLFALQDMEQQTTLLAAIASDSTDIVMSLQMWRGNNQQLKQLAPTVRSSLEKEKTSIPCPLAWAVQHKSVDMVSLLLEFNNPQSELGYRLNDALCVAVVNANTVDGTYNNNKNDDDDVDVDEISLDIIRILVAAGANPCAIDIDDKQSNSAVALAAIRGRPERLHQLLHSYDEYLRRIRLQRRQDPKLQRQPESFFLGMEGVENTERLIAGKDALLLLLPMIRSGGGSKCIDRHRKCCLILYEHGIQLGLSDMGLLQYNMNLNAGYHSQYKSTYQRLVIPGYSTTHIQDRDQGIYYWSHIMSVLPWFKYDEGQKCAFFSSTHRIGNMSYAFAAELPEPDIIIMCNDGYTLLAHRIVLNQSQKLHAAIRFASMRDEHCQDDSSTTSTTQKCSTITMDVNLPYDICRQLLVHLYHGSILDIALPKSANDSQEYCLQLFELMMVADEYICTSLIHECILRLLASEDMYDQCFCCYCQQQQEQQQQQQRCDSDITETTTTIQQHSNNDDETTYWTTCTYHVIGPSYLITANLVLDVLAIAQHVNWCPDHNSNNDNTAVVVKQQSRTTTTTTTTKQRTKKNLIDHLREVALSVAISDFGTVIRSPSFLNQLDDTTTTSRGMLLTSLLNDFLEVGRI